MNEKIWKIILGIEPWMNPTSKFPESKLCNYMMRAILSLEVLILNGSNFNVNYGNGDEITLQFKPFKYYVSRVQTNDWYYGKYFSGPISRLVALETFASKYETK